MATKVIDSVKQKLEDEIFELLSPLSATESIVSSEALPSYTATQAKGALDSLAARGLVTYKTIVREVVSVEPEGQAILVHGSHEVRVANALASVQKPLALL